MGLGFTAAETLVGLVVVVVMVVETAAVVVVVAEVTVESISTVNDS